MRRMVNPCKWLALLAKKLGAIFNMMRSNKLAGAILLLLGMGIYLAGRSFPAMPEGHPGPGLFPSGIGILLTLSAILLLFSSGEEKTSSKTEESSVGRLLMLLLAVAVFPFIYQFGNFFLGLFITISAVGILFKITWWKGLFISAVTCGAIYLVFNKLLQVQL